MGSVAGLSVLITGASSGIGRATSLAFVGEGASVWAVARDRARLDDLSREAGGPPRLVALVGDVSDGPGMEALAQTVLRNLGIPDVVVANAGVGLDARFEHTRDDDCRKVLEVNVIGVLRTVRPFVAPMVERGSGRILMVSSVVGKRGVPNYAAYSASKFALHGMAGALRTELRGTGVTVGLVCPSSTETEFRGRMTRAGPSQPSVRFARHTADSVARAIVRMATGTRREVVLSLEGKLMAVAEKFAPGLLDRILHRALVRGG